MDLPGGTVTVTAMTPADELLKFCLENKHQRSVIDELLERGYDSLQALSLIDMEDLKSQKIPIGQRRLVIHIAKSLSGETPMAHATTGPNSSPLDTLRDAQQPPAQQPPAAAQHPTSEQAPPVAGDVYSQTLIRSLMSQQMDLASRWEPTPTNRINDVPPNLAQLSWQDPQVHIANATGKSASPYYDICDFVPNVVEEELVVGGQGEQKLVLKSAPKKPKLESLTLSQWSFANLAILYKLVGEGKLAGSGLMDYLSYTTKVYQLVQRCSLVSVLLYDREYRQLQSNMQFRWGSDVQHLHTLHLQPRDRLPAHGASSKKSNPQTQFPKKPEKKEQNVCRNYNSVKGCPFPQCRYKHTCIVPGCGQDHPVSSHVALKN